MGLLVQDAVTPSAWRKIADASLCVAVFATAFFYRFNTISGPLGGFTNDQFGYLARARQIQSGEVPFLDFNDPGWFLTDYLSAAAQWIGGYSLRSEALLTVGLLSIGAVVMFALARRATGSVFAACVAAALLVAIAPRHYNYPKIVLYATALALAWAYIGKPGRARLGALGALIGIAFLFRHDHLIYLGAFGLLTIAFAHRASIQDGLRAALGLGAATAVFVVPFLVFLALSGGIGEYFRLALVYAQREAERTDFSAPLFSRDSSRSFATLTLTRSARINVRWQPVSEEQRRDREARYRLVAGRLVEGTTWTYVLRDVSRANIEPLVRDPLVDDTHGLSRATFTADAPRWLRLETQLGHPAERNRVSVLHVSDHAPYRWIRAVQIASRCGCNSRVVNCGASRAAPRVGWHAERRTSQPSQHARQGARRRRDGRSFSWFGSRSRWYPAMAVWWCLVARRACWCAPRPWCCCVLLR